MFEGFGSFVMSRRAITRLFKVAIALVIASAVSGTVVVIVALANGAVAFGGSTVVTINPGPFAGAVVGLIVASLLTAIGTIAAVIAWAGALLNTYRLEDKTWFSTLLVSGLVSLGWIAMLAYVLRGPDSTTAPTRAAGSRAETPNIERLGSAR
jgi:hypothetical protein